MPWVSPWPAQSLPRATCQIRQHATLAHTRAHRRGQGHTRTRIYGLRAHASTPSHHGPAHSTTGLHPFPTLWGASAGLAAWRAPSQANTWLNTSDRSSRRSQQPQIAAACGGRSTSQIVAHSRTFLRRAIQSTESWEHPRAVPTIKKSWGAKGGNWSLLIRAERTDFMRCFRNEFDR